MVQTTEVRYGSDLAFSKNRSGIGRVFSQRQASARSVVIVGIGGKHEAQVRFTKYKYVIQALAPDRSDKALNISILPWRPRCCGSAPEAHGIEVPPEDRSIDTIAIAIANEVFGRCISRKRLGDLMRDPVGRRIGGNGDVHQPAVADGPWPWTSPRSIEPHRSLTSRVRRECVARPTRGLAMLTSWIKSRTSPSILGRPG